MFENNLKGSWTLWFGTPEESGQMCVQMHMQISTAHHGQVLWLKEAQRERERGL